MEKVKSFNISKRQVWEAYKCVKANRGSAGIDNQSIADFEEVIGNIFFKITYGLIIYPSTSTIRFYTFVRFPNLTF